MSCDRTEGEGNSRRDRAKRRKREMEALRDPLAFTFPSGAFSWYYVYPYVLHTCMLNVVTKASGTFPFVS